MTRVRTPRSIVVALLACLIPSGIAAAPTPPGGGEAPSYRDSCENVGKYLNADYDRDGLSGYQECQLGSDPHDTDSDGDLLWDGKEASLGTDLSYWDTDWDLLSDCWEHETALDGWPTDPLVAGFDADGDGIADDLEVFKGLNPGNVDTDQDMLSDGEEVLSQGCGVKGPTWTSALNPDCDGDGLVDGVEANSLGTKWWDPDSDGDGYTDGDEVLTWGTDPLDPNDPSTRNPPDYHP